MLHDTRKEVPPDDTRVIGYYLSNYDLTMPVLYSEEYGWLFDDEQDYEELEPPDAWQYYATRDEVTAFLAGEGW